MAAVLTGWLGTRPPQHTWCSGHPVSQPSTRSLELDPGGWDGIRLEEASPPFGWLDVCARGEGGSPVLATSDYSRDTYPERSIATAAREWTSGDTLAVWPDRWLVCALPDDEGLAGDLLLWYPESWYVKAGAEARADTIALFRHNYALSFKLLDLDALTSSVRATARGEMASVYSRLLIVDLEGEELSRFAFDPRYTADAGFPFETRNGPVVLVETDGGYSNSDLFYLLLAQPVLSDGARIAVTSSDDIEGSYRGFFAVDLRMNTPLWYRRLGLSSTAYHPVDLDLDGVDELLVETYSAENSVSGGGTTDVGTGYLLCVDQGGNIIWRKRVHGVHTGVQCAVADVVGDERPEIMMVWSSSRYEELGGAAVLSADGTTLVERTDLGGLYALAAADFDGDGEVEFATGGPGGRVHLLDGSLRLDHSRRDTTDVLRAHCGLDGSPSDMPFQGAGLIWRRRVMPLAASDMDGDGIDDLVALQTAMYRWDVPGVRTIWCGRSDVVVYDGRLDEMMRAIVIAGETPSRKHPADAPASRKLQCFPFDTDADGRDEFVLGSRGQGIYVFGEAP